MSITIDNFASIGFPNYDNAFSIINLCLSHGEWVVADLTKSTALSEVMFAILQWESQNDDVQVEFVPFFDQYENQRVRAIFSKVESE